MQFLSPTRNVQRYKQFRFIMQIIVYDALSACVPSGHVRSLQPHVAASVCDFCISSRFTMQMLMGDFCLKQYDITAHVGIKQVNNKYSRGVSVVAMKGQKLFCMLAPAREK